MSYWNRTCPQCSNTFTPARSGHEFCSTRCRVAAHRDAKAKRAEAARVAAALERKKERDAKAVKATAKKKARHK